MYVCTYIQYICMYVCIYEYWQLLTTKARTKFFFFSKIFVFLLALEPATLERPTEAAVGRNSLELLTCDVMYKNSDTIYEHTCLFENLIY